MRDGQLCRRRITGTDEETENNAASDAQLVAEITKQVMAQLGMK